MVALLSMVKQLFGLKELTLGTRAAGVKLQVGLLRDNVDEDKTTWGSCVSGTKREDREGKCASWT